MYESAPSDVRKRRGELQDVTSRVNETVPFRKSCELSPPLTVQKQISEEQFDSYISLMVQEVMKA